MPLTPVQLVPHFPPITSIYRGAWGYAFSALRPSILSLEVSAEEKALTQDIERGTEEEFEARLNKLPLGSKVYLVQEVYRRHLEDQQNKAKHTKGSPIKSLADIYHPGVSRRSTFSTYMQALDTELEQTCFRHYGRTRPQIFFQRLMDWQVSMDDWKQMTPAERTLILTEGSQDSMVVSRFSTIVDHAADIPVAIQELIRDTDQYAHTKRGKIIVQGQLQRPPNAKKFVYPSLAEYAYKAGVEGMTGISPEIEL